MRDLCNAHMELHSKSHVDIQITRAGRKPVGRDNPAITQSAQAPTTQFGPLVTRVLRWGKEGGRAFDNVSCQQLTQQA